MSELADETDSKSVISNGVRVQVPLPAERNALKMGVLFIRVRPQHPWIFNIDRRVTGEGGFKEYGWDRYFHRYFLLFREPAQLLKQCNMC